MSVKPCEVITVGIVVGALAGMVSDDAVPPCVSGDIQEKLMALTINSANVTVIKSIVPPSQSNPSRRPGWSSHQRT